MNQYLRNLVDYEYRNELLERVIRSMWELVNDSPAFDKNYTLYRFIHDDSYLKHLNIGDEFIDPSFISTTRDPFYRAETYKFGFILIKIHIPAKQKGVGLCVESYSHFPDEQEIILSPLSVLKLIKKDENASYYHTDDIFASKVATRYEFEYMGKKAIEFTNRPLLNNNSKIVDFLGIEIHKSLTIYERIKQFLNDNVNDIYQFKTQIGKFELDLIVEWYDSTNAYKKFYASTTNNGFSIYTFRHNYMSFVIELGENNNTPYMYVNYYFKYAASNKDKNIHDIEFIEFLSKVAYYFGIRNVILYTEYASCDIGKLINEKKDNNTNNSEMNDIKAHKGGNYCIDFYKYLKFKERRFRNSKVNIDIDSTELRPQFSYYELDRLRTTKTMTILNKNDRDEVYQLYTKIYKLYVEDENDNLANFYVWMVENHCVYLKILIKKMIRLYSKNNPFKYDYYILDAGRHLYNKNLIDEAPVYENTNDTRNTISNRIPKNEYRLSYYERKRVPSSI